MSEMRPSLNDVVQSPPRRQNVGHVTVPHQQVVGDQVPLDHGTLDQVLGCLQRCGIGRGTREGAHKGEAQGNVIVAGGVGTLDTPAYSFIDDAILADEEVVPNITRVQSIHEGGLDILDQHATLIRPVAGSPRGVDNDDILSRLVHLGTVGLPGIPSRPLNNKWANFLETCILLRGQAALAFHKEWLDIQG